MSLLIALIALAWLPGAQADDASKLYKEGRKAERNGQMAEAYLLYSKAAALAPKKKIYWLKSQAVRTRAAAQSKFEIPATSGAEPEIPAEEDTSDTVTDGDLRESRKPLPPAELTASPGRKDFDLKLEPKALFTAVAQAFGLDVVFDGDYPDQGQKRLFQIQQADYREALRAVEALTGSFVVPLNGRLFLAVKDTQQKRADVEPAVTVVIPIPQTITVQEAQELARAVQQVMDIKRFGIDSVHRMVILNGSIGKVRPAQRLFEELSTYRAEVSIDLEFLEVARNETLSYGLTLPTSLSIVPLTTILHNVPSLTSGLSYFLFGGGASVFAVGVGNGAVAANFNKSTSRLLLKTTIRSGDGMPATFHVGEKYPILTSGYFGPASFSGPGAYTPPPSFNFEDLGLVLKVTPKIHGMDDVSLDLEAEFKVLSGSAVNGIPIVSSRKLTSKVRLKEGETAVVAGVMNPSEARTIAGVAGLERIPGLGWLTSQHDTTRSGDDVLILIRPHLVHPPPDDALTKPIWVGADTRPLESL